MTVLETNQGTGLWMEEMATAKHFPPSIQKMKTSSLKSTCRRS